MLFNLSLSYGAGTALTLSIHSSRHSLNSSASTTSDAQLTTLMHLINTATIELNNILKNHLRQPQQIDCLTSDLMDLINEKYDSLIEGEKTQVKNLLNAASNILEYPSAEVSPLLNNTGQVIEKLSS